jgi:hypothetical protein
LNPVASCGHARLFLANKLGEKAVNELVMDASEFLTLRRWSAAWVVARAAMKVGAALGVRLMEPNPADARSRLAACQKRVALAGFALLRGNGAVRPAELAALELLVDLDVDSCVDVVECERRVDAWRKALRRAKVVLRRRSGRAAPYLVLEGDRSTRARAVGAMLGFGGQNPPKKVVSVQWNSRHRRARLRHERQRTAGTRTEAVDR